MIKGIIFDFDGTLANTLPVILPVTITARKKYWERKLTVLRLLKHSDCP